MAIYTRDELLDMGFHSIGEDVRISTRASIYAPHQISIGNHVRIDDFCVLSGQITLGSYIHIAVHSSLFGGREGIVIDDFANISSRVAIYALSDDYSGQSMSNPMIPDKYKQVDHGKVIIGKHCIIGTASTVLPHVTIGEGCAFGAYSLIKHSCESWGIYAGIPCVKKAERDRNLLAFEKQLLEEVSS